MSTHVMLDLETLGIGSFAPILSIGAVKFNPNYLAGTLTEFLDTTEGFHVRVSLASVMRLGLMPDAGTIEFWLSKKQEEARDAVMEMEALDIVEALDGFNQWFGEDKPVWGNGATFDNVILSNTYGRCGIEKPWGYKNDRCYRTLKSFVPICKPRDIGIAHTALADAQSQAWHMQHLVRLIGTENGHLGIIGLNL